MRRRFSRRPKRRTYRKRKSFKRKGLRPLRIGYRF